MAYKPKIFFNDAGSTFKPPTEDKIFCWGQGGKTPRREKNKKKNAFFKYETGYKSRMKKEMEREYAKYSFKDIRIYGLMNGQKIRSEV